MTDKKISKKSEQNKELKNIPKATHSSNMKEVFGVDVDCYVLDESAERISVQE